MASGNVLIYFSRFGKPLQTHHKIVLNLAAETIAKIKGYDFGGHYDTARDYPGPLYFVPDDTVLLNEAACLGIRSPNDLYGGVVPYLFAKTKAITHGLVDLHAERPLGWCSAFTERVREIVLPGYTVFSDRDARVAAGRMLTRGPVRLKKPASASGRDQTVVASWNELDAVLEKVTEDEMATYGLVLEENLRQVRTLSIGEIAIGGVRISYHGTQRTVRDNQGRPVYGGSDLVCVRGGWEALDALPMVPEVHAAVVAARRYDEATAEFHGFVASRRNYDVGQGIGVDDRPPIRRARAVLAGWGREQCRARGIGCLRIRPVLADRQSLACRGVRQRLPSARRCDGRFSGGRSRGGPNAPLHDRDAPKPAASKNLADPARFGGACHPA